MLLPEEENEGKKFMYGAFKKDGIHSHHDVGQHEVTADPRTYWYQETRSR